MRLLNCGIIVVAAGLLVANFTVSQWTTTPGWNFTNITSSCGPTYLRATPGVTGVINSPNYPNHYPNSEACIWSISTSDNYVIEVTVVDLRVESCFNCSCDFVSIYDGIQSNATLLQKLCSFSPGKIKSTGKIMRIEFVADAISTDFGFQLNFTAVPVTSLLSTFSSSRTTAPTTRWPPSTTTSSGIYLQASTSETKSISYPGNRWNYPNYDDRRWQIRADDGYVVKLSVYNLHIEYCPNCTCDQLQIFDGYIDANMCTAVNPGSDNTQGPRIRQYCGTLSSDVVYTTQKYAFIIFTSDSSNTDKGFFIAYRAVTYDPAFYQTTKRSTSFIEVYQTTVWMPTYSEDQATSLVVIIAGCLTGLFILVIFVVLIFFYVKRRQARLLNTYSNLPHTGNTVTVTSTTVPAMHYYQPNSGVVVAGPGVVYPAQSAPPPFINEAFTPDLIPTSNQPLPPQTGQ